MENNAEKLLADSSSPERTPFLGAVKVKANFVDEAMWREGNCAGQAELDWVLTHPEEARKMLKGNGSFFFPEAVRNNSHMPYVYWRERDGLFSQISVRRDCEWLSDSRVVLLVD